MNPNLQKLINAFEEVQKRHAKFGAMDTEPDGVFQVVIKRAVDRRDVDWHKLDWEIFDDMPGAGQVADELTEAARKVYDWVRARASAADVKKLQDYCWRVSW